MKKLAIVTTHPIQYNAPWFKLINDRGKVDLKVFYTWGDSVLKDKYDPGFKKTITWDIPLLEGYRYRFVKNISKDPGSHHFKGVDNPSLVQEIEQWGADAVLVFGWSYKSHLQCMRYFKGRIPVLFRGDSTLLDEKFGVKKIIRRIFLRWVYSHVDTALYVGTNNKRYYLSHGLKESQLIPAWHAIDNERFSATEENLENNMAVLRQRLAITPSQFVVLFAGKLEPKKNPAFLCNLAKNMADPDLVFLLTGNGELEPELKQQSANDPRIKFLDFQNQSMMPAVYRLANVFVLPSNGPGETWGLAVNEAMACGLPVIVSNKAGGAIDLVKENGLILGADPLLEAQRFISELKNDRTRYQQASRRSKQHIRNFNFTQIAEAVEKACRER